MTAPTRRSGSAFRPPRGLHRTHIFCELLKSLQAANFGDAFNERRRFCIAARGGPASARLRREERCLVPVPLVAELGGGPSRETFIYPAGRARARRNAIPTPTLDLLAILVVYV